MQRLGINRLNSCPKLRCCVCRLKPNPIITGRAVDCMHGEPGEAAEACAGVPSFLAHVPVLGSTLRDICVRAVRRTLEDVESAIHKVQAGYKWEDIVRPKVKWYAVQCVAWHPLQQLSFACPQHGS